MAYEHILFAQAGGVARLTLNRPERLNSFNDAMHAEVRDALDASGPTHRRACCSLTGAGPRLLRRTGPRRSRRGPRAPSRSISAHRSSATTGRWCSRCAGCRCRSCARSTASPPARAPTSRSPATSSSPRKSASFIQAFSKIGLVPDSGGTYFLPRLVGTARAMGLALLGERLIAEQAADWGLIWQCVDDAELTCTVENAACAPRAGARRAASRAPSARSTPPPATRSKPSSTSSAICSASSAAATIIAKAWPRSRQARAALRRTVGRRSPSRAMGAASPRRHARRSAGARRAGRGRHVGARPRLAGARHADRSGRARPRRARDDRARGHAQRPRDLPWRLHLHACRQRLRLRLQQLQSDHGRVRLRDRLPRAGARGRSC